MTQREPSASLSRRLFVGMAGAAAAGFLSAGGCSGRATSVRSRPTAPDPDRGRLRLFLSGDVMTGRGVDQVLPHSVDPRLFEPYVSSADTYVRIAEEKNGPIPERVGYDYPWGDAIEVLEAYRPAARIINLETAVTDGGEPWLGKGIHYRMHPGNTPVLEEAGVDCCVLANNHVLDWGRQGLADTVAALDEAGIAHTGGGMSLGAAAEPAVVPVEDGRQLVVFGLGHGSSGIFPQWKATEHTPGVWMTQLSDETVHRLAEVVEAITAPGDTVVVSIHWGGNWGWEIPDAHRRFAHALIAEAGVDVVHGHSSHHPKGVEVYRGRLILYGCGDFINDYEGIQGHERYRPDLRVMYLPTLDADTGELVALDMVPLEAHRFRLRRPSSAQTRWLTDTLDRECRPWGSRVHRAPDGSLALHWRGEPVR